MKSKILVLGANGFIGKNLASYIAQNHYIDKHVFYFASKSEFAEPVQDINYLRFDFFEPLSLQTILAEVVPDYIINLAGTLDNNDINKCLALNAELSRRVLETIIDLKLEIKKVLFIGSAAEYGANSVIPLSENHELLPITPYGLSKVIQTQYFNYYTRKFKIPANIARTFNIIGRSMSDKLSIGSFIKQINNSKDEDVIFTGNLSSERDYLFINDVLDAFFKILFEGKAGQIYNVCSGSHIAMSKILDSLIKVSGKSITVNVKPELVKKDDIPVSCGDNNKLFKDTGWRQRYKIEEIYDNLL
ncbi:NAD-dependent epimerase/dehydratase family protein [Mucilaginibacter mali]|uniref:NAD-dependent epimerase/dehydratase family protein n=1 Tax=Mucilaginibacter mali TaxID=2740462 RepID=A0A7D4Q800_9SPHI|nr:NAD-dependent epimerase/dehydratase family protein [Mucilaginibacter mali]QKJ29405.1 NAD-dependent epimerase/dehydratase family protein [Mucilaginibacter mali]